jgi:hypothetical protein
MIRASLNREFSPLMERVEFGSLYSPRISQKIVGKKGNHIGTPTFVSAQLAYPAS